MNTLEKRQSIVNQIKKYMGDKRAVIGMSGGVDSALISFLCTEALGPERIISRTMPYGDQSTQDADIVARILGVGNYGHINIKPTVDSFGFTSSLAIGNAKARVRMINLYALAGENNGIVVGTSNKTEMWIGYFTKFGDGGCDIEPIADLFKTEVWEMSRTYPNFPTGIIEKSPSAELWSGQTDEGEIGMKYYKMDEILKRILSSGHTLGQREILENECGKDEVNNILSRMANSEHKRRMPVSFMVE